jgi:hypothetical protein
LNKRQRKKLDKKLFKAIKELNEDVAKDLDIEHEIGTEEFEEGLWDAFYRVKKYNTINKTLKTHKKVVVDGGNY